nr:hypothetical protein [Nonomuraea phyllanthi]
MEVLGRLRSDRVLLRPAPSREEFLLAGPCGGRPPKHGGEFRMKDETSWGEPAHLTSTATSRYGTAVASCWDRLHPRLGRRSAWRRFDLEHTFRMWKQTLGWAVPKIRDPYAADRWTWLIIIAYARLRLARLLAGDLRRPWERPLSPERLTPARVRTLIPSVVSSAWTRR